MWGLGISESGDGWAPRFDLCSVFGCTRGMEVSGREVGGLPFAFFIFIIYLFFMCRSCFFDISLVKLFFFFGRV